MQQLEANGWHKVIFFTFMAIFTADNDILPSTTNTNQVAKYGEFSTDPGGLDAGDLRRNSAWPNER